MSAALSAADEPAQREDPNRHLDAAFGWRHPYEAQRWHEACQVGVCATLTVAIIKIRNLRE